MANEEQLSILRQGVEGWNKWREKNPEAAIDLREADLRRANLSLANLISADLRFADLTEALLSSANLAEAHLDRADLGYANLYTANLYAAYLDEANLNRAKLMYANLKGANFAKAHLSGAIFDGADLTEAHLIGADLRESKFSQTRVGSTVFGSSDLSEAIGLEDAVHEYPSTIGADTFARSKGKIHEVFLRGCGLSDWEIEMVKLYNPDLNNEERNKILYKVYDLQASQAIQISPLFISYSQLDGVFVDKIQSQLNKRGIRFWRDIHDMKAGRMEKQINRAIRQNPTVLLVLSENALKSDWVEHEVRTARGLEKEMGRDILCPVALDDSWKSSQWPKRIMEQIMEYNILDFSAWQDDVKFEGMFRKLIDGLELFYKG